MSIAAYARQFTTVVQTPKQHLHAYVTRPDKQQLQLATISPNTTTPPQHAPRNTRAHIQSTQARVQKGSRFQRARHRNNKATHDTDPRMRTATVRSFPTPALA